MTHALEWPSLTCQWLPTLKNAGETASEHSLLLGTHTTGEQNYLMVASCNLPKEDAVIDNRAQQQPGGGGGGGAGGGGADGAGGVADAKVAAAASSAATTTAPLVAAYDEEKKEVGGFGHAASNIGKIEIRMKVQHQGEVNRARYMPQNHFIVATRGPDPELYVFDLSKHPSFPEEGSVFSPQAVCVGHTKEGYGMAWSKLKEGHLLSGSEDSTVCLWDIQAGASSSTDKGGRKVQALSTFRGHSDVVEDVDWHAKDPHMIASVSDDRSIRIWDTREPQKAVHIVPNAHEADVNCVAFNPINEMIFATGSADKMVALWDIRNLKAYVNCNFCFFDMELLLLPLPLAPCNLLILVFSSFLLPSTLNLAIHLFSSSLYYYPTDTVGVKLWPVTPTKSTWSNGHRSMNPFWDRAVPIDAWPCGTCHVLAWNKRQKMPKMVHRNSCFCMEVIRLKYPTFPGINRIIGRLPVSPKTMSYKSGVWPKKFMPAKRPPRKTKVMGKAKIKYWETMN